MPTLPEPFPGRQPPAAPLELRGLAQAAGSLIEETLAPSTRRAYAQAWRDFAGWCELRGLEPLPAKPETVALYLTARAEPRDGAELPQLAARTLGKVASAIGKAHELTGQASPTQAPAVRMVLKGIRRRHGKPAEGKRPALLRTLSTLLDQVDTTTTKGVRDRALLLLGWASALRRSELVSIDVGHLELREEGYVVRLQRSKTDQESEGRPIGVPRASRTGFCPVSAVQAWIELAQLEDGPLFRPVDRHGRIGSSRLSPAGVAKVVKARAREAGLEVSDFAGHSLRAGFITECARLGIPDREIQAQSGHKSLKVLRDYVRHGSVFVGNAAAQVL